MNLRDLSHTMRLYNADSGEILINQQNIREISRNHLRKNVAIVLQDTVLFSDTVRHNLVYGNENATDAQVQKAMEMSRCDDDMLQKLPQGMDTMLTGSGENISQGQRQLLARKGKYYELYMAQYAGFAT